MQSMIRWALVALVSVWTLACDDVADRVVSADLGGGPDGGLADGGLDGAPPVALDLGRADGAVPDGGPDAQRSDASADGAVDRGVDPGDAAVDGAAPDGGRACAALDDCGADEACGADGQCAPRCEPGGCGDGHCGAGWICEEGGCLVDVACVPGSWCDAEVCQPGCRLAPDDCPAGMACGIDHQCRPIEGCNAGAPCETGLSGICARGRVICQGDEGVCAPFEPARANEACDGRDDDCDGQIDEDFSVGEACQSGQGICQLAGVLACADGAAVCVTEGEAPEPQRELCNQLDDNCDGQIDELFDLGAPCQVAAGACAAEGQRVCDGEGGARCSALPRAPVDEACNGVDDDCDGLVDEQAGGGALQQVCYDGPLETEGVGGCRAGVRVCREGAWGLCEGEVLPAAEQCNGLDDDCNHFVDDDRGAALLEACFEGPAAAVDQGRCRAGTRRCQEGAWGLCLAQVLPAEEICDQVDNDCNGATDDTPGGCACAPGATQACYSGAPGTVDRGACQAGRQICAADGSGWGPCDGEVSPAAEVCDGVDNDCDGAVDDGIAGLGEVCLTGIGACQARGVAECDEAGGLRCAGDRVAPVPEACDGVDNDCDGSTDEAFAIGEACSVGQGICARAGGLACTPAGAVACDALIGLAEAERCNGLDDDCDGEVDDGFELGAACTVGEGQCARPGVRRCGAAGEAVCDAVAGAPAVEICNGLDDDCDGDLDEGFDVGAACAAGVGACVQAGALRCVANGGVACSAAPLAPTDEVCNGVDDNCNGAVDDGLADLGACQTAQAGVCRAGRLACIAGARLCGPLVQPSAEVCNGLDDDCDGTVDDETGTVDCGEGVCARTLPACEAGAPVVCDPLVGAQDQELCNGLDDDCDGRVDEAAQGDGLACGVGVGVCARSGVAHCVAGALVCDAEAAQPAAERCNNLDDDCDGLTDEDAVDPNAPCAVGIGACARRGSPVCRQGQVECIGQPGAPFDELCNAVDDDCDGQIDEGLGGVVCGVGQCRRELVACADGAPPLECQPMLGATAEVCDGVDNDCDGAVDEQVPEIGAMCAVGQGVCRVQGVGACEDGAFRCVAQVPPAGVEVCNNLDDDCDGQTDEQPVDVGAACTSGVGACAAAGLLRCAGGQLACDAVAGLPQAEVCNGDDDNCDGSVDEALGTQACGVGQCRRDLPVCTDGAEVACDPLAGAEAEVCNGLDDDCDGQVDDGVPGAGAACARGVGACLSQGQRICVGGEMGCDAAVLEPGVEACNGVDDDCDGSTDEGFALGAACELGVGACAAQGQRVCDAQGGVVCDAQPGVAVAERCNGLDDDCDGVVDQGLDDLGPCDTGEAGVCAAGRSACQGAQLVCVQRAAAGAEVCDGLDNNCDGQADEALGARPCGLGVCLRDAAFCVNGAPQACDPLLGAGLEMCNGLDDDCDGAVDDDTQGAGVGCEVGEGACRAAGVVRCAAGALACDAVAGVPQGELCNGVDDDCDGVVDEDPADVGPCDAGLGECRRVGVRVCQGGALVCPVQAGLPAVEICDGLDNNCDGQLDEGFEGSVTCGLGACRHAVPNCDGGQAVACDPLEGASPEQCNGIDDDCDGEIDEAVPGTGEACGAGVGACRRDGATACTGGRLICGVQPGEPLAEQCNGVDDDCDGETDEAAAGVGQACSAGQGICEAQGQQICLVGQLTCDAQPGAAGAERCNGLDDDCDGATDEALGTQACGVGACQRQLPICTDGQLVNCDPMAGAGAEQCNGADDDCDGTTDEGLADVPCGVGLCARMIPACMDGALSQCNPQLGAVAETCNLEDDDCDGATDEDVAPEVCSAGVGACALPGQALCQGGQMICAAQPGQPVPEACNGVDDDCDGSTDEAPMVGVGEDCAVGVGACQDVQATVCVDGREICPAAAGAPVAEICDQLDNDCDGRVDENGPDCNGNNVGDACEIAFGAVQDCNNNATPDTCDVAAATSADCNDNGVPDECNGDGADCVPDLTPPVVDLFLQGTVINPGSTIQVVVRTPVPDESGIAQRGLLHDGVPVAIDPQGQAFVLFDAPGFHQMVGWAVDGAGNRGEDTGVVRVLDPADLDPPVLDLINPPNGAVAVGDVPFVVTATDENLVRWRLTWGPEGDPEAVVLAEGVDSVENANVATLATAGLAAARYDIRLFAEDINGRGLQLTGFFLIEDCAPEAELCDGRDNDCDGVADEDFNGLAQPCTSGVGGCAVDGTRICGAQGVGTVCDALPGLPQVESCDGLDNDCDGAIDERWNVDQICTVGLGACGRQGRMVCTANGADAVCDAQPGDPVDELCNGLDEDCDGDIDEGIFGCGADTPPTVAIVARPEVADSVAEAIEVTVNADDDVAVVSLTLTLDGVAVPLDAASHVTLNFDRPGVYHLRAVARDQANQETIAELQLRVLDPTDQRNPFVDIGEPRPDEFIVDDKMIRGDIEDATLIEWRLTYGPEADPAANLLAEGSGNVTGDIALFSADLMPNGFVVLRIVAIDVNGRFSVTERRFILDRCEPVAEICDGADNDCDGAIDEGLVGCEGDNTPPVVDLLVSADVINPGTEITVQVAANDNIGVVRTTLTLNGVLMPTDGGFIRLVLNEPGRMLWVGTATDAAGNSTSQEHVVRVLAPDDAEFPEVVVHSPLPGAVLAAPTAVVATLSDANPWQWWLYQGTPAVPRQSTQATGYDAVDQAVIGVVDPTGLPPGDYVFEVTFEDLNGRVRTVTVPFVVAPCVPVAEICNLTDDDCDGAIDETFADLGQPCGGGLGVCEVAGVLQCQADGQATVCSVLPPEPQVERCDGVDNDCDGATDEDFAIGAPCTAGLGICARAGLLHCGVDGTDCSAQPGAPEVEACDGLDNDCDGAVDEACPDAVAPEVQVSVDPDAAAVGQPVLIAVLATDNRGVDRVELTVDGVVLALDVNGHATFVPLQAANYTVRAQAWDAAGLTATAQVQLPVVEAAPTAVVTATPARLARGDNQTVITLDASGSFGGGALTYAWSVPNAVVVAGALDAAMVQVTLPGTFDHPWSVRVRNALGADTVAGVVAINTRPLASIAGSNQVEVGAVLTLDGRGSSDADDDALQFAWRVLEAPLGAEGAFVDASAPVGTVVPDVGGLYRFELIVGDGLVESAPVVRTVMATSADVAAPAVQVAYSGNPVAVGAVVTVQVQAQDASGIAARRLWIDGVETALDANGAAQFVAAEAGRYAVRAEATDVAGNLGGARGGLFVFTADVDDGAPTVAITGPDEGALIAGPWTLTGTVADTDLAGYVVELSPRGEDVWSQALAATGAVNDDVLGQIDVGALAEGFYDVRLRAFDEQGNTATVGTYIEVPPGKTFGRMRRVFRDARAPVAGIPIEIRRVYDSGRKVRGDFGVAWDLDIGAGRYEASNPPAEGWTWNGRCVPIFGPAPAVTETQDHILTIMLGDEGYRFYVRVVFRACGGGFQEAVVEIEPLPGTDATLEPLDGTLVWHINGTLFVAGDVFQEWDPTRYRLTLPGGRTIIYDTTAGVRQVDDDGHQLIIDDTGVHHDSGVSITLDRDAAGRVTRLALPDGNARTYQYDAQGDLIRTVDFRGGETFYRYDLDHNLLRIVDPRGNVPLSMEYDETGRVVAYVDGNGARVAIDSDPVGRQQVITDRRDNVSIYSYDADGNVTEIVDPLGGRTQFTYDAAGNLLTKTDPNGALTQNTYDGANNRTQRVDPNGQAWTWTYDAQGNVRTAADPLGNTTTHTYDAEGRVTQTEDRAGAITAWAYDAAGNNTGFTDAEGNAIGLGYTASGALSQLTDAAGTVFDMTNDGAGNLLRSTHTRQTVDGAEQVVWAYSHDQDGELSTITGPAGETVRFVRDEAGQAVGAEDPLGNQTDLDLDAFGRIRQRQTPGGGTLQVEYDAEGNDTAVTLPGGVRLERDYDALNRLTTVRTPEGGVITQTFDAGGRVLERSSALGAALNYTYDAAGNVLRVDAPGGASTVYTRDIAGRVTGITDAEGGAWQFTLDGEGRTTRTVLPGGAEEHRAYDGIGRLVDLVGPSGGRWQFAWGATGDLATVTDPANGVTTYGHDTHGQYDRLTDASGRITTFLFDALGRLTRRTMPLGQIEHMTYDAKGRPATHTDFLGGVTAYTYDLGDRLTRLVDPTGAAVDHSYNAAGQAVRVTDARGETLLERDVRGRVTRRVEPSGDAVARSYDLDGRIVSTDTPAGRTTFSYNPRSELVALQEPSGETFNITRDRLGRPVVVTLPGGDTLARTYDALGHVLTLQHRTTADAVVVDLTYTHDAAGRISRIVEDDGRTVDYTYDALDRLLTERITEADLSVETLGYTYDPVGNVISRTDAGGARAAQYDANDRLLDDGRHTYQWDANGRVIGRQGGVDEQWRYDGQGRLIAIERVGADDISYAYTEDGLLAWRQEGALQQRFVWDRGRGLPLLAEILDDRDGSLITRFVYGAGAPLAQIHGDGRMERFTVDHQGSVRAITGAGQTTRRRYDAYGAVRGPQPASGLGYIGGWTDASTGMVFLRTRWYDPAATRFITPDQHDGRPDDPRTLNRYSYSLGDPINRSDPNGQFSIASVSVSLTIVGILANIALTAYPSALEFIFNGLGAFSALRFQNQTAVVFPFLSASATRGVAAAVFGMELLRFNSGIWALYAYFGVGLSFGGGDGASVNLNLAAGAVYDTPEPSSYTAWFIAISASGTALVHALKRHVAALPGAITFGKAFAVFWSPTPTFEDAGGENRFSHGWSHTAQSWGFGGGMTDQISGNITISFTYYLKLLELGHRPGDQYDNLDFGF
jgi:RHS repeat-associated protein